MANSKVNWYENDVLLTVEGATDEMLAKLAFQGEGLAKVAANWETGFMRNAIYGIAPGQDHRAQAVAEAKAAAADREVAPRPSLGEHEAAIHGAAEYTIYQEARVGFMYGAVEQLARYVPAIISEVGRQYFG